MVTFHVCEFMKVFDIWGVDEAPMTLSTLPINQIINADFKEGTTSQKYSSYRW